MINTAITLTNMITEVLYKKRREGGDEGRKERKGRKTNKIAYTM